VKDEADAGEADVIVIGGGIAGVSAAYQVSKERRVLLLERESQLAHHTTGRSAALYLVSEGGAVAQRLALASHGFFSSPPPELVDAPILETRGVVMVGPEPWQGRIRQMAKDGQELDPTIRLLDETEIMKLVPVLRPEFAAIGMYEPGAAVVDVMGLHQAFVRGARANGARVERYQDVTSIEWRKDRWHVGTDRANWIGGVVVNAAGAWGDVIGRLAGARPVDLTPMRRTAFTVSVDADTSGWPFVHIDSDDGPCYFKPEAGNQLMCSPADEIVSQPCDARPEELDIAIGIERINNATTLGIRGIRTSWAGLRSFVPDRSPVLGWDDQAPNFCWMVGQGGFGITTSEASGRAVASVVTGVPLPTDLSRLGLTKEHLAPRR